MSRLRLVALSAAVLALLAAGLRAQTPAAASGQADAQAAPQQPTFRARVDQVTVDATVEDKQGHIVPDLKASDFTVREDGKLQTVTSFKFINIDDEILPDPAKYPEIHSMEDQERETARDDVRIIVIFLDDYHVKRGDDLGMAKHLSDWVSTLNPRDLLAVVYPLTPLDAITFTRNDDGIAQAIRHFVGRKYDYTPRNAYENIYVRMTPQQIEELRNEIVMRQLAGLCKYLGALRQGRKDVLFVSEGFSATLPPGFGQTVTVAPPPGATQMAGTMEFSNAMNLMDDMKQVYEAASRNNTSFYTLDPRGLTSEEFDLSMPHVDSSEDQRVLTDSQDSLRVLASETDGRAIVNRNDFRPALQQMLADESGYYLLGYTSTNAPRDGKFHDIKVTVDRKDLEVRSRKGYWAYTEDDVKRATAPAKPGLAPDLVAALGTIAMPPRGHAIRTWTGFDRGPDGKTQVTLVWEALPAGSAAGGEDAVTANVTAGGAGGELYFHGLVDKTAGAAAAGGRVTFAAKPGTLDLRVEAESADGGILDVDQRAVTVPDFSAAGPTISTPDVYRGRTARDVRAIAADPASMVPTATRQFSRTERIIVRFHAYGPAGSAPTVTLKLLNEGGGLISAVPTPAPAADGAYSLELPVASLPAGDYLLEIDATAGSGQSRAVVGFGVTS